MTYTDHLVQVLHPSFKKQYFLSAKWEPDWITVAVSNLKKEWENNYKSVTLPTVSPATRLGRTDSRDVSDHPSDWLV
jgi:hypothetical protein